MTAAQLRLLVVLAHQLVAYRVEQLDVALARVLLEGADKGVAHGARRLAGDARVGARLRVLAAAPHDDVGRRRLGAQVALPRVVARRRLFEEAERRAGHAANVAARVRRHDAEKALPGFFGQVGLLEHALRRVNVGQVESGARVARVEDGREAHAGLQRRHHDAVHLVVDNVSSLAKVDGVNDFVVAVLFVAVQILGLSTVSCNC